MGKGGKGFRRYRYPDVRQPSCAVLMVENRVRERVQALRQDRLCGKRGRWGTQRELPSSPDTLLSRCTEHAFLPCPLRLTLPVTCCMARLLHPTSHRTSVRFGSPTFPRRKPFCQFRAGLQLHLLCLLLLAIIPVALLHHALVVAGLLQPLLIITLHMMLYPCSVGMGREGSKWGWEGVLRLGPSHGPMGWECCARSCVEPRLEPGA